MSSYISAELRRSVTERANHRCEYCHIREEDMFFGCEVDHIISIKHGGATTEDNLAYACMACNRQKGSDLGSILWQSGELIRFFNPRTDRIFEFNSEERILEREELIGLKRYP